MGPLKNTVFAIGQSMADMMPPAVRGTWALRAFGLLKVPLILYANPTVQELSDNVCAVKIPLTWRTKNHYKSMYIGALVIGADCTGGLLAMHHTRASDKDVRLLFKDMKAQFLKRPEGDVLFTCSNGPELKAAVQETAATGERINIPVDIVATVPKSDSPNDPVATFTLTISLKRAKSKRVQ
jgi:hypothetical protein